jgi:hypothetical protein
LVSVKAHRLKPSIHQMPHHRWAKLINAQLWFTLLVPSLSSPGYLKFHSIIILTRPVFMFEATCSSTLPLSSVYSLPFVLRHCYDGLTKYINWTLSQTFLNGLKLR